MHSKLLGLTSKLAKSDLTKISDPFLDKHAVELWIKRDDLIHPIISGNKWRKLKYNLDAALGQDAEILISMGGTHSNHLHALAFVGKLLELKTIGIVRGEQTKPLTQTLNDLETWGMELRYISRTDFRVYRNYKTIRDLPEMIPKAYWLPEGGANQFALKGVGELLDELTIPFDTLCVGCGTGATLAGLVNAAEGRYSLLGFAALKNTGFLEREIKTLLKQSYSNWKVINEYTFGGFAQFNQALLDFMHAFEYQTGIKLDVVYTGKLLFGIYDLIGKGYFKPGQRIIAVHTGGLQGNRGNVP